MAIGKESLGSQLGSLGALQTKSHYFLPMRVSVVKELPSLCMEERSSPARLPVDTCVHAMLILYSEALRKRDAPLELIPSVRMSAKVR